MEVKATMTNDTKSTEGKNGATILIKKYANRRLYHTQRSTYVTLDDLSLMVKNNEEFVVQDAKSGEDIPRSVLNQIIFDAENSGNMMLPTPFLREIIRLYGDTMESLVPNYLENAMKNFMEHQEQFRTSLTSNPAMQGFEQLSKMNADWMAQSMKMFDVINPLAKHDAKPENSDSELKEMKDQLREMQNKLSKLVDD